MIQRVFSVEIHSELRSEFEEKFSTLALPDTLSAQGCTAVEIFRPTDCNPNVYLMISSWKSEEALEQKFGSNWHEASIPNAMKKFERAHSIHHYKSW
ncbi:MAG: antibiotic biosynthesis monooxygenase [Acidiferrobacterales bacterium]|nr:antibiotic biosynthesis monooxygenase [Acidiferrobacterales bacterium]